MNFNPYVVEKLIFEKELEIQKESRRAWYFSAIWNEKVSRFSIIAKLFNRKPSNVRIAAAQPCCNCC